jgi:hypothetical protein
MRRVRGALSAEITVERTPHPPFGHLLPQGEGRRFDNGVPATMYEDSSEDQDQTSKIDAMQRRIDEGLASGEAKPFDLPTFLVAMSSRHEIDRQ